MDLNKTTTLVVVPEELRLQDVAAAPVVGKLGPVVEVGLVLRLIVQGHFKRDERTSSLLLEDHLCNPIFFLAYLASGVPELCRLEVG